MLKLGYTMGKKELVSKTRKVTVTRDNRFTYYDVKNLGLYAISNADLETLHKEYREEQHSCSTNTTR